MSSVCFKSLEQFANHWSRNSTAETHLANRIESARVGSNRSHHVHTSMRLPYTGRASVDHERTSSLTPFATVRNTVYPKRDGVGPRVTKLLPSHVSRHREFSQPWCLESCTPLCKRTWKIYISSLPSVSAFRNMQLYAPVSEGTRTEVVSRRLSFDTGDGYLKGLTPCTQCDVPQYPIPGTAIDCVCIDGTNGINEEEEWYR